jgi:periplasmic protein CpxP/Spy
MKRACLAFVLFSVLLGGTHAQEVGAARSAAPGGASEVMCRPYEHIDGQLAYIRAELKLTPAQEAQWNVFANVFRDDKERQAQNCRHAQEQNRQMAAASLPDSMNLKAQHLTEQLDSLRKLQAAVQLFYDSLSKEQKKIADEIMKGAP